MNIWEGSVVGDLLIWRWKTKRKALHKNRFQVGI